MANDDSSPRLGNPWGYRPSPLCQEAAQKCRALLRDLHIQPEHGKTFGVLIAKRPDGATVTLHAFSGLLNGESFLSGFVPPIFDWANADGFFRKEEARVSLLSNPIEKANASRRLQQWLFNNYMVRNAQGSTQSIADIWKPLHKLPPAGTGECAAPKLLHFAFSNHLTPLEMAEFTLDDDTPRFVPSCTEKCGPLLRFMLQGVKLLPKVKMSTTSANAASQHVENHPLGLFIPSNAWIIFLGSFPPKRVRWSIDFYYPNFQNDMWRVQGLIWFNDSHHFELPEQKKFNKPALISFLKDKGIALGDTALKVIRENNDSSDLHLRIVQPLDLDDLLRRAPNLKVIVSTGGKSAETFCSLAGITNIPKVGECTDFTFDNRQLRFFRMPSTSRAYPMTLQKKADFYARLFQPLQ